MPLERTPLAAGDLSPAAARACSPQTPGPARLMAARGMVPMGPRDLTLALYQLALDPEPQIRTAALQSVAALPERLLAPVLGEALDARVLDFYAELVLEQRPLVERLILNPATHDETLVLLAERSDEPGIEMLAANEQRLLRYPRIIETIYLNKNARMSTVDRLVELAIRNGVVLAGIPTFDEVAAALGYAVQADGSLVRVTQIVQAVPPTQDADFQAALAVDGELPAEGDTTIEQEIVEEKKKKKDVVLGQLSLSGKIRVATLGNAFQRAVLIRDSNKLVALAAIKSPAITDNEIVKVSAMRNVIDDVIKYISIKKAYLRHYQVKLNLVNNPRCPLPTAMKLMQQLRDNDIRAVGRSKHVSPTLARFANQYLEKKK